MGRKNSSHASDIEEDEQSEVQMQTKVQNAIKELPSLPEKMQAIAINSYLIEKRELDKKLGEELNKVEVQNRKQYQPLLEQIVKIAAGQIDLTDQDLEGVEDLLTDQEKEVKKNYYPAKQIQEYWLKCLLSSDVLAEEVKEADEKILKHLTKMEAEKTEDGKNLTVIFHFSENEWFTNLSIKKQFQLDSDTIKRSFGDSIDWKEGKNITIEIVKKKNKKKKTTTTKQIKKESFFNIFSQVDLTSDSEEDEKEKEEQEENSQVQELEKQYQICNCIYEEILPRSLEFYLGVVGAMGDLGEDFMKGMEAIEQGSFQDEDPEEGTAGDKKQPKKSKSKSKSRKRKGSHASKD